MNRRKLIFESGEHPPIHGFRFAFLNRTLGGQMIADRTSKILRPSEADDEDRIDIKRFYSLSNKQLSKVMEEYAEIKCAENPYWATQYHRTVYLERAHEASQMLEGKIKDLLKQGEDRPEIQPKLKALRELNGQLYSMRRQLKETKEPSEIYRIGKSMEQNFSVACQTVINNPELKEHRGFFSKLLNQVIHTLTNGNKELQSGTQKAIDKAHLKLLGENTPRLSR
jgi:hypothetical protein